MAKRIDVTDLDVFYGSFKAVEGVTFSVEPRSVTALIGPSGCGKSTVLRTLNRMHEVIPGAYAEGTVLLVGEDIYGADIDPVNVRRTILKIVLPTAMSGIITGAMLAIARVAGETAPLLLTTFISQSINPNPFKGPQAALPTFIWDQFTNGTDVSVNRAWGAALVLIVLVMVLYATAKLISRFTGVKSS